jgi:hypothetical protein
MNEFNPMTFGAAFQQQRVPGQDTLPAGQQHPSMIHTPVGGAGSPGVPIAMPTSREELQKLVRVS